MSVPAGDETTNFYSTNVNVALLIPGTNLIAVEVHQINTTSSDVSFDFELSGQFAAPSPSLAGTSINGQLQLTWPDWAAGYSLYAATNLTPPVSWTRVPDEPTLSNNVWRATAPLETNGQRFFRLKNQ